MKNQNRFLLLALGAVLLASCAKEKEYDEVYKEPETLKKTDIRTLEADGTPTKYLYVPMTLGTPRKVADANPFYQGQAKLVNLNFSKAGLEVHEIEADTRFGSNDLNKMPVFTIPVEYKSFDCKEDQYGDCTNAEEEVTDLTWEQKDFFVPDYTSIEFKEINELDLYNIEGNSCVSLEGTKVVDTQVSKDGVLNIKLEKTFKLSKEWKCIRNNYFNDDLSSSSFKVSFYYSLVKLDNLASKDYEKVKYEVADHSAFGFFKEEAKKLNDVFDPSREDITYYLNRWNPKKKVLNYYLSKSFNEPNNAGILKATMESMVTMNKNLAEAGLGFRLNFIQQTGEEEVSPGDLRYSTIVLIDDPLANGLLGYAPTVKNPETGEILQGHVNMYGGVLQSGTRYVYESAVDVMIQQKALADSAEGKKIAKINFSKDLYDSSSLPEALRGYKPYDFPVEPTVDADEVVGPTIAAAKAFSNKNVFEANKFKSMKSKVNLSKVTKAYQRQFETKFDSSANFDRLMNNDFSGMSEIEKRAVQHEVKENGYASHAKHSPEFFPINGTVKVVYPALLDIPGIMDANGILKRWNLLNKMQKDQVTEIIKVQRYISTFVHEMGHSLGLRHNFAGSTDGANFYTDAEAVKLGMKKAPAYSSVMDYAVSEFNELAAFGKYDVAALRFGYTQTLKTEVGTVIPFPNGEVSVRDFRKEFSKEVQKAVIDKAVAIGVPKDMPYADVVALLIQVVNDTDTYAQDLRDYVQTILNLSKEVLPDYNFCTDENAGLSATCNRFDEGSNLYEIAKFRTERYNTVYKYRNFRDDKGRFKTTDLDEYVVARYREFGTIRDIFEMYDLYAQYLGRDTMDQECSVAQIKTNKICEINEAVKVIGDFFINIIKTPDLTCALGAEGNATVVTKLVKLADLQDELNDSLPKGQYMVSSCFDPIVAKHFADSKLVVIGENGKFLNSLRDTNTDFKYADDIAVRGIWTDKAMAMRFLFERRHQNGTSDENQLALIDHPYIRAEYNKLIKHLVLGFKLDKPVPFKTINGEEFEIPYIVEADTKINQIESGLEWLNRYFGLEDNGSGSLVETLLKQVKNANIDIQGNASEIQYQTNNYVTVRKTEGYISEDRRYPGFLFMVDDRDTSGKIKSLESSKVNNIAYHLMSATLKQEEFSKIEKDVFKKVLESKSNPTAPSSYDEVDKGFFSLSKSNQKTVIGVVSNSKLTKEAFISYAGDEVIGTNMFNAYEKARKLESIAFLEKIIKDKAEIIKSGPLDSTEVEKMLYFYDAEFLELFSKDKVTKDLQEYYFKQLLDLPDFI